MMDEFARAQAETTLSDIWGMLQACLRKYSQAAGLVGFREEEVDRIRQVMLHGDVDITPLLPAWDIICDRYRRGDPDQCDLFFEKQSRLTVAEWQRFLHWSLIPKLVEENMFVLSVLRAVGLLSCESQNEAAEDVKRHVSQMYLRGFSDEAIF